MIFISNNAAGYLVIAFFIAYTTKVLGLEMAPVLLATTIGSFGWLIFTLVGGWLSDKIGRRNTFVIGYGIVFVWMIPMFMLVDTGSIVLYTVAIFVLTIGLGLSYGPQSAMYAEMFPAHIRYSGISIGYAIGAILGGAFAATVAQVLLETTGWSGSIAIYIMVLTVISTAAVLWVGETRHRSLGVEASTRTAPPRSERALGKDNRRRAGAATGTGPWDGEQIPEPTRPGAFVFGNPDGKPLDCAGDMTR